MVGFGRKKTTKGSIFGDSTGKVDKSSLLDGNGEPTTSTLYDNNVEKKVKRVTDNQQDEMEETNSQEKKKSRSWFGLGRLGRKN